MLLIILSTFYIGKYDEKEEAGTSVHHKKNNVLPLWGNERSMNLNPLILTNIQSSHYFKGIPSKLNNPDLICQLYVLFTLQLIYTS